jgi:hypothetical protein
MFLGEGLELDWLLPFRSNRDFIWRGSHGRLGNLGLRSYSYRTSLMKWSVGRPEEIAMQIENNDITQPDMMVPVLLTRSRPRTGHAPKTSPTMTRMPLHPSGDAFSPARRLFGSRWWLTDARPVLPGSPHRLRSVVRCTAAGVHYTTDNIVSSIWAKDSYRQAR